jgi:pimeloyl-ACP methyl ester carboxylesterase
MAIDHDFLRSLRSFEDLRLGVRELFLVPFIGGSRTVAVLSTPLRRQRRMGWVICHSFGMEQIYLQPLEVTISRRLAANGFPVLRFHAQGYGDSAEATESLTLGSHIRDSLEAARLLAEATSVTRIGLIGGRFGGTVAALAADELDASGLVLWEPVVEGRRYVNALLRAGVVADLASRSQVRSSERDPLQELDEAGVVDVEGFPLQRSVVEEMSSISLPDALTRFRGDSLIVQISRSAEEKPDLQRLVARLRAFGGRSSHRVLMDPQARMFGLQRYHRSQEGRKADTQAELSRAISVETVAWCMGDADPSDTQSQEDEP